jgi:hypothetical protein
MRNRALTVFIIVFLLTFLTCLLGPLVYNLPPVHDRLDWRVSFALTKLKYALNPPQQVVFVPQEQVDVIVQATLTALIPSVTSSPTIIASLENTPTQPGPGVTPEPSATPLPTFTPIPGKVLLTGVVHQYQKFNNCGPANLAMALSFWGWQGDQMDTAAYLRPDTRDKNVMPAEMVGFVEKFTSLKAMVHFGGDLDLLKQFLAAGYPVIIEKGHDPANDWWMGHYLVLSGYEDAKSRFISQDSLIMANLPVPYQEIELRWWRDFNYVYLVIYPPERSSEVINILGPQVDDRFNYQFAALKAENEIPNLHGRDLFFAWYNLGTNRVALQDYTGAAEAYDIAFTIYPRLSEDDRPYRMLWYQVGPYPAYFYTGRYQDVINLANTTFAWVGEPVLEETYFWRAMAYLALGNTQKAVSDFKKAAKLNPNSTDAIAQLAHLGVAFP